MSQSCCPISDHYFDTKCYDFAYRKWKRKRNVVTSRGLGLHRKREKDQSTRMLEYYSLSIIQNQSSLYICVTTFPNRMLVISLLSHTCPCLAVIHYTHTRTTQVFICYTLQCYATQVQIRFLTLPLPFKAPCPQGEERLAATNAEIPK